MSYHTRSSIGSVRSAASARAKVTARKAALEAKAEILEHLQQLEVEELILQQRRKQLTLRGEIAAAEAEKDGYDQVESEVLNKGFSSPVPSKKFETYRLKDVTPSEGTSGAKLRSTTTKHESTSISTPVLPNNPLISQSDDESFRRLVEVQDQQSYALQQLMKQQQEGVKALTLPQPSMQIFSGNPIDYCDFIRSFEHLIESKTASPSARLYYLIQHTSGSSQELMKSCLSMREEGYDEARRLLKERFGQNYRVAAAHVQRLITGPPIKNEDGTALQQFSVQLTSCTNTLEKIGYLEKLYNSDNLKKIIDRLSYLMRIKWRDTVDRIIEKEARDVTVKDINDFVTAKARDTTYPIFGKISSIDKPKFPNSKVKRNGGAAGFSNQGTPVTPKCPLCQSNHWLSRCEKFRKLEERQRLVKEKKVM